jgi:hypothetical protein
MLRMILTMVLCCARLGMQAQQSVAASSNVTVPALMRFAKHFNEIGV